MRHDCARLAIAAVLDAPGLGPRALACLQAAQLASTARCPPEISALVAARAQALPADPICACAEASGEAVPEQVDQLARQLVGFAIDHPCQIGASLAGIQALVEFWPHVSRAERLELRRRWRCQTGAQRCPSEACVDRKTLREWSRRLPTMHEDCGDHSALTGLLEADDAETAFQELAVLLGPGTDFPALAGALGTLAGQALRHRFDLQGWSHQTLLAAVAAQRLGSLIPPEMLVTLLCQIAHQVWWCHKAAGMRGLQPGSCDSGLGLAEAVHQGDYTASQRAARQLSADPERFWRCAFDLLAGLAESGNTAWPRALSSTLIACWRTGDNPISPDDAACLGAALAATTWLASSRSAV